MDIPFDERLRRERRRRGETQEQAAVHFNVSQAALNRWENTANYPSDKHRPAMCAYLGLTIDELLQSMKGGDYGVGESGVPGTLESLRTEVADQARTINGLVDRVAKLELRVDK